MSTVRLLLPIPFLRCGLCCALAAAGCQSAPVVQPWVPIAPPGAPIVQPAPPPIFAAPPMVSGQGVMVDPFAMNPAATPSINAPAAVVDADDSSRIHVPVADRDWTWEQIVDAVDDYFRIERERNVQLVGDILTEGRIDTYPLIGATIVEPHRRDSVGRYNRWESTFQTIRRRGTVRVIPDATGYLVDVTVEKDLEDLPRPEHSTAGPASFRNDSSLASKAGDEVSRTELASHWILVGRDPPLEQRILADIQARLTGLPAP